MPETGFDERLARLVAACEAGLDLDGVLACARDAVSAALSADGTAAYGPSDDGAELVLRQGDGPTALDAPGLEPLLEGDRALLPLVSARRSLGCILATGVGRPAGLSRARLAAGIAAQAAESSRLWESAGGGAGTLDLLTGLPNHRGFQSVLARELARAKRTGASLAVSVVDLDGLAEFNRRYGAAEGDRMVRAAGSALSTGVRSYDCVCRLDEDEFALVLPGITAEPAAALVGRLSQAFAATPTGGQAITLSGGVAAFPEHAATQNELVRLAESALTQARGQGGGRVVAWDAGAGTGTTDAQRRELDREIRALEASRGHAAEARAASEYAGHIACAMGLDPDRSDRLRLAAYLYDATSPAGAPERRTQAAARVTALAIDEEAASWLLARDAPVAEAPLEARVLAVADAFVTAGGYRSDAAAGRALAELWERAGDQLDVDCVRALERLLAEPPTDQR